jgi:hypothetical protein
MGMSGIINVSNTRGLKADRVSKRAAKRRF